MLFLTFFYNACEIENARLSLAIPAGAQITVANDAIEMISLVTDKTIKDLSK